MGSWCKTTQQPHGGANLKSSPTCHVHATSLLQVTDEVDQLTVEVEHLHPTFWRTDGLIGRQQEVRSNAADVLHTASRSFSQLSSTSRHQCHVQQDKPVWHTVPVGSNWFLVSCVMSSRSRTSEERLQNLVGPVALLQRPSQTVKQTQHSELKADENTFTSEQNTDKHLQLSMVQ